MMHGILKNEGMMSVVSMGEFKELRDLKRAEESYGRYLKTLANSQLEIEVNSLLEEFSGDLYGKDYFSKGHLILKEITARASGPVKSKIELLTTDTLRLL
jgi:hypothetical protein